MNIEHPTSNVEWSALTLTLSPGEREQQSAQPDMSHDYPATTDFQFVEGRVNYSPSPGGEGRGEGGQDTNIGMVHDWK